MTVMQQSIQPSGLVLLSQYERLRALSAWAFVHGYAHFFSWFEHHDSSAMNSKRGYNLAMSENDNSKSEGSVKLCPKCPEYGRVEPNERYVGPTGRQWGYCKPCTYQYQKDRRAAQDTLRSFVEVTDEVQRALVLLEPKRRGRKSNDNVCPRCAKAQRQEGSSYCSGCAKAYRQERKRQIDEAASRARAAIELAEHKRREEADRLFEEAFGFKPQPTEANPNE